MFSIRKLLSEIWPGTEPENETNPPEVFASYERRLAAFAARRAASVDDAVSDLAQELFDRDVARRDSIFSRAQAILPAIGIGAALVSSIGFTLLTKQSDFGSLPRAAQTAVMVCYVGALVFLLRSGVLALRLHGKQTTQTLGPDDIIPGRLYGDAREYKREITLARLAAVIANYRGTNRRMEFLSAAQRNIRNAALAIVLAGIVPALLWIMRAISELWAAWRVH